MLAFLILKNVSLNLAYLKQLIMLASKKKKIMHSLKSAKGVEFPLYRIETKIFSYISSGNDIPFSRYSLVRIPCIALLSHLDVKHE